MSLFDTLKDDFLAARKSMIPQKTPELTVRTSILRLLVSEFDAKGNDVPDQSDEVVYKKIREFIESNELVMENNVEGSEKYIKADMENAILKSYLPKQLSEDELEMEMIVIKKKHGLDSMAGMKVMKEELESKFPNQYDKSLLGKIGKKILN